MITKIYEIPIDIDKGVLINRIIKVVTQDLGTNMIRFKFVKDGRVPVDLTGTIVRLIAKSRSGSTIQQECVIENAIEGVVTITLKQSMFAEDGTYIAELQISDSSTQSIRLTTPTFNYFSRKSLQDDDVVVAGDDYSILQDLMNDLAGIDVVIMQGKLDALESQLNENATELETHKAESASKHIKESGSNPNGSYIKFDDGTMICRYNSPDIVVTTISEAEGGVTVYRTLVDWTYPASFVAAPSPFLQNNIIFETQIRRFTSTKIQNTSNTMAQFQCFGLTDFNLISQSSFIAIGRWK